MIGEVRGRAARRCLPRRRRARRLRSPPTRDRRGDGRVRPRSHRRARSRRSGSSSRGRTSTSRTPSRGRSRRTRRRLPSSHTCYHMLASADRCGPPAGDAGAADHGPRALRDRRRAARRRGRRRPVALDLPAIFGDVAKRSRAAVPRIDDKAQKMIFAGSGGPRRDQGGRGRRRVVAPAAAQPVPNHLRRLRQARAARRPSVAPAAIPKKDKLLHLHVDLGEAAPRTIVAGIALGSRRRRWSAARSWWSPTWRRAP